MKKLILMMVMMMTTVVSASAMTYTEARSEARFLTDRMARDLMLTDRQYAHVYEINLEYMASLSAHAPHHGSPSARRNVALRHVLTPRQYDRYMASGYATYSVAPRPPKAHGHWRDRAPKPHSHARPHHHR